MKLKETSIWRGHVQTQANKHHKNVTHTLALADLQETECKYKQNQKTLQSCTII